MRTNLTGRKSELPGVAVILFALLAASISGAAASLKVVEFTSRALANNALHDPATRPVAVFFPAQFTNGAPLPLVYYLPGYGNQAQNFIRSSNEWENFAQKLADDVTPVVLVVVDGKTKWGGSQYLNSPAQGNYADYLCKEIVAKVEAEFPAPQTGVRRVIAGHSSGGFGALRLGSAFPKLFDAVVALSPDSDFPTTHLPLVKLPGVANVTPDQIKAIFAGKMPAPKDGDLEYALGLSAAYAPRPGIYRGEIDWLYDAHGKFRDDVWRRWLDNDPLTIVRKNPNAFLAGQAIYLEGAAHDEFSANIGARKIYEVLRERPARCAFYEPPGHHSDHVQARLERGVAWVFEKPLQDIR